MAPDDKGALFPAEGGVRERVKAFLQKAISQGCFDAVLIPAKAPGTDSLAYSLIGDEQLLENTYPLPPVMPVQGAKAISSLTRTGQGKMKIAALIRPCELRATVELFKLGQVDLDNICLISIDCPGALPLAEWARDVKKAEDAFAEILKKGPNENIRPVCQICDKFSTTGAEDLHIGVPGGKASGILLIPGSPKGEAILECLGITAGEDLSRWKEQVDKLTGARVEKKRQAQLELEARSKGLDKLLDTFSQCINCHNCMRVCPICYCQQCFFESENLQFPFEDYLKRAEAAGGLRLPPDTLLFHIGRMLHMSLSCVSCGACEDACPTAIPVAQVFSLVGNRNQEAFNYVPGRSRDESPPLRVYQEEEFEEVEQSHAAVPAKQEARDG
jgi:formate dehydrogenase subunit beta